MCLEYMNLLLYSISLLPLLEPKSALWSAPSAHSLLTGVDTSSGQVLSLGPVCSWFDPLSSNPHLLVEHPASPVSSSLLPPTVLSLPIQPLSASRGSSAGPTTSSLPTPVAHCLPTGISPVHPRPTSSPGPTILPNTAFHSSPGGS